MKKLLPILLLLLAPLEAISSAPDEGVKLTFLGDKGAQKNQKKSFGISNPVPGYQNYPSIVKQLKEWERQVPALAQVGTYGKSSRGRDLTFLRIHPKKAGKVVLIHSCIHGNEPLATSTLMGFIGTLLSKYGADEKATALLNSLDLYFVPVLSPDSYPSSRYVDGVDPNRNYPTSNNPDFKSTPSVQAMQDLFRKIQPKAVLSGHTSGRMLVIPYGDSRTLCPNHTDFVRISSEMQKQSGYRVLRGCEMYGRPIFGSELDWYYRNGAFPLIMEFGTHQHIPSLYDVKEELDRTKGALLLFLQEAPLVEIKK